MQLERIPSTADHPVDPAELRGRLEVEGFSVWSWTDAPGATYTPHTHDQDESLWVIAGEITFGAGGQEIRLGPGDRLMLPRGTVHSAQVGATGATYLVGERVER
jgi:quercetin dioxygenase-like cupin family protein